MKAIIIAAGMGRRLEHHTDAQPKCMVEVGGRSILQHQLEALRAHGIRDIHVVRGYLADELVVPGGATYHHNPDFRHNNILHSLFCAESAMAEGPFVTTYSDIVYTPDVVGALLASPHDITLTVDTHWHRAYEGREDHPPAQAELTEVAGDRVRAVGKQVGPGDALGEFIGLASFSERGGQLWLDTWREVRRDTGDDAPFQAAPEFRRAYQTDLFLELIERGHDVGYVAIEGGWREIDTVEDLERVNRAWPDL